MEIIILGAGSFAREVADMALDLGWTVEGFVVDAPGPHRCSPLMAPNGLAGRVYVPGIVSPRRRQLGEKMGNCLPLTLIHPSASVSEYAEIGRGVIVGRLVAVGVGAKIGWLSILNRGCTVGHDCFIGECVTIGPGANLAGSVIVGPDAVIGMGANVLEGLTVGPGAVVGAGAVVTRDVPPGETWWGVPARRVR